MLRHKTKGKSLLSNKQTIASKTSLSGSELHYALFWLSGFILFYFCIDENNPCFADIRMKNTFCRMLPTNHSNNSSDQNTKKKKKKSDQWIAQFML